MKYKIEIIKVGNSDGNVEYISARKNNFYMEIIPKLVHPFDKDCNYSSFEQFNKECAAWKEQYTNLKIFGCKLAPKIHFYLRDISISDFVRRLQLIKSGKL